MPRPSGSSYVIQIEKEIDMTVYNVSVPRQYEDKKGETQTSWKDIGLAMDTKNGIRLNLNFMPLVKDGEPESIFLFPRKEKESS